MECSTCSMMLHMHTNNGKNRINHCLPRLCWCPLNRCTDFVLKNSNSYSYHRISKRDTHYLIYGYLRQLNYNTSFVTFGKIVEGYWGYHGNSVRFSFKTNHNLQSSQVKTLLIGIFDINCNSDYIFGNCNDPKSNFLFNVDLNRLRVSFSNFIFEIGLFVIPKRAKEIRGNNKHDINTYNSLVKLIQQKIDDNYNRTTGCLNNFNANDNTTSCSIIRNLNLWSTSPNKNDKKTNRTDDNQYHDDKYNFDCQYYGSVLDYRGIHQRYYYQMKKNDKTIREFETQLLTRDELDKLGKLRRYKYWKNYGFTDMLQGPCCRCWSATSIGVGLIQHKFKKHVSVVYVRNDIKWSLNRNNNTNLTKEKELILMNEINIKKDELNNYYFFPVFAIYAPFAAYFHKNGRTRKYMQFSVEMQDIHLENVHLGSASRYCSPYKIVADEITTFCFDFCHVFDKKIIHSPN